MIVIDGEHVGPLVAQDVRQPLGGFVDVGGPERSVLVVLGRSHHPRVDVAEKLDALRTEDLGGRLGLEDPALPERFALVQESLGDFAVLSSRGHHQHDTVTVGRRLRHRAAGGDAFVVRVGVEADKGRHRREP